MDIRIGVRIADDDFHEPVDYNVEVIAKDAPLGNVKWRKNWESEAVIRIPTGYEHYTFKVSGSGFVSHVQHYLAEDLNSLSQLAFELLPDGLEDFSAEQTDDGGLSVYFPNDRCKLYTRVDVAEGFKVTYSLVTRDASASGIPVAESRMIECFSEDQGKATTTLCYSVNAFQNTPFVYADDFCSNISLPDNGSMKDVDVTTVVLIEYYPPGQPVNGEGTLAGFYHVWPGSDDNASGRSEAVIPRYTGQRREYLEKWQATRRHAN